MIYIYIYYNEFEKVGPPKKIYRYSTFECFKFQFIPKQLNTNVIRWPVIR